MPTRKQIEAAEKAAAADEARAKEARANEARANEARANEARAKAAAAATRYMKRKRSKNKYSLVDTPESGLSAVEAIAEKHSMYMLNRPDCHDIFDLKTDTVKFHGLSTRMKCTECEAPGATKFCLQCTRKWHFGILFMTCRECSKPDGKHATRWAQNSDQSSEENDDNEETY